MTIIIDENIDFFKIPFSDVQINVNPVEAQILIMDALNDKDRVTCEYDVLRLLSYLAKYGRTRGFQILFEIKENGVFELPFLNTTREFVFSTHPPASHIFGLSLDYDNIFGEMLVEYYQGKMIYEYAIALSERKELPK